MEPFIHETGPKGSRQPAAVAAAGLRPRLKIFFDGGCRPNPGRMEAAVVARGRAYLLPDLGHGGNDDAEWLALIEAARIAVTLGESDVLFLGDSALVVDQAGKTPRGRGRFAHHRAAFEALARQLSSVRVRRIGRAQNLAGIALEKAHGRR